MNPQVLTTTSSAPSGCGNHPVAVQLQQPGHPLAIDEILGAAEADQGEGAGGGFLGARTHWRGGSLPVDLIGRAVCDNGFKRECRSTHLTAIVLTRP